MRSLLCEHLRSKPFPNIDGEFIDCGESGNQGDARSGAQGSEIKLFPYALIWNRSYPVGDVSRMLDWPIRFESTTADSSCGEFVGSQKSFGERMRHKRS